MALLDTISVSPETYAMVKAEAKRRGTSVRALMDHILEGEFQMPKADPPNRLTWNKVGIPPKVFAALEARGQANGTSAAHEARVILQAVMESTCS